MRVERNEVVALLGRNGAGKSTTLKSLMGCRQSRRPPRRHRRRSRRSCPSPRQSRQRPRRRLKCRSRPCPPRRRRSPSPNRRRRPTRSTPTRSPTKLPRRSSVRSPAWAPGSSTPVAAVWAVNWSRSQGTPAARRSVFCSPGVVGNTRMDARGAATPAAEVLATGILAPSTAPAGRDALAKNARSNARPRRHALLQKPAGDGSGADRCTPRTGSPPRRPSGRWRRRRPGRCGSSPAHPRTSRTVRASRTACSPAAASAPRPRRVADREHFGVRRRVAGELALVVTAAITSPSRTTTAPMGTSSWAVASTAWSSASRIASSSVSVPSQRRGWDSNPRKVALHTLSKRADSAALAPLPGAQG